MKKRIKMIWSEAMNEIEYKMTEVCMRRNMINEKIFNSQLLRMWENDLINLTQLQTICQALNE